MIKQNKNIILDGKIIVNGRPLIQVENGSRIIIGNNVTLNSNNIGYHINMHSPVKLFANSLFSDRGAIIKIGQNTRIHGSCIHAYEKIVVGRNCLIGANCQIFDGNGHDLSFHSPADRINTKGSSNPIIIEDYVWIGTNCIILPGTRVGEGSVIAAGSVVVKDVPSFAIAGGNPSRVIEKHYERK